MLRMTDFSCTAPFRVMMTTPLDGINAAPPGGIEPPHVALAEGLAEAGADITLVVPPWSSEIPLSSYLLSAAEIGNKQFVRFRARQGFNWITVERTGTGDKTMRTGRPRSDDLSGHCVRSLLTFAHDAFDIPRLFGLKPDVVLLHGVVSAFLPIALKQCETEDFMLEGVKTVFMRGGWDHASFAPVSREAIMATGLPEETIRHYRYGGGFDLLEGALRLADAALPQTANIRQPEMERLVARLKEIAGLNG